MKITTRTLLLATLFTFAATAAVQADAPPEKEVDKSKIAVTDASKADPDFAYQGEFFGSVLSTNGWPEVVGLQVVAQGAGKFEIFYLRGGLPGGGWDRHTKTKINGILKDDAVVGKTEQIAVTISSEEAILRTATGAVLGKLPRIRRISPTMGQTPPPNAIVLFNGTTPTNLDGAKISADGLLEIGATTKMKVQDFQLHVEFRLPYMPYARGQGRGNSGVYIQQRYELQILDSFGLEGVENECGSLYRQQRPEVNMTLPPLSWQTYDINFTAARWDAAGNKIANTHITVYHNGMPIHCNRDVPAKTGAGQKETPEPRAIHFQNHGNPVQYRNMWIVLNDSSLAGTALAGVSATGCPTACCESQICRPLMFSGRRCP